MTRGAFSRRSRDQSATGRGSVFSGGELTTTMRAFMFLALLAATACAQDWRDADRSSAKIAPLPADEPRALVQVYAARAVSWRGWFAVHTWIAIKEKNAPSYEVMQVVGFRLHHGLPA